MAFKIILSVQFFCWNQHKFCLMLLLMKLKQQLKYLNTLQPIDILTTNLLSSEIMIESILKFCCH